MDFSMLSWKEGSFESHDPMPLSGANVPSVNSYEKKIVYLVRSVHLVELRGSGQLYALKAMDKTVIMNRNKVHTWI